jgi:membrane-associated phospholipid phosphatase
VIKKINSTNIIFTKFLIILLFLSFNFTSAQKYPLSDTSHYNEPQNIDVRLFRTINNSRSDFFNSVIPYTDKSMIPVSIILPAALFTVSRINDRYYDENSAVLTALSELTGSVLTITLKNIIKRERPFRSLRNVYHEKNKPLTDIFSFPSGHTTIAFALATSLTLRYPDKPFLITGLYLYSTVVSLG